MKFKNFKILFFFSLLLILSIVSLWVYRHIYQPIGNQTDDTAIIREVIDGDTYKIFFRGKEEKLRLIGLDTPETEANRKAKKDAHLQDHSIETILNRGNQARQYVRTLLTPGTRLRLEFDVQTRDRYDRLLAYAYLDNGEMLNAKIIEDGFAIPMAYPPNIRYQQKFNILYQKARLQKKGLWQTADH